jgi:hypothetical protein
MRSLIEFAGFERSDLIQTLLDAPKRPVHADVRRVADRFENIRSFHGASCGGESRTKAPIVRASVDD